MSAQGKFPFKFVNTPLGLMPQGEFLAKVEWPEEQKQFFRQTWKNSPELSVEEILHIQQSQMLEDNAFGESKAASETQEIILSVHIPAEDSEEESNAQQSSENLLDGIESEGIVIPKLDEEGEENPSENLLTPFNGVESGGIAIPKLDEEGEENTSENLLTPFNEVDSSRMAIPKLDEDSESKEVVDKPLEIITPLPITSMEDSPLKVPGSPRSPEMISMASLTDTMELRIPRPLKNPTAKVSQLSPGELGRRRRDRKKRPTSTREGGDFFAVKCKKCSRLIKIVPDNAGKRVRCKVCMGSVYIPDARFFLRHDLSSAVLGPFPTSQQAQLIRQGKIELDMYISLDQARWKTIETAGRDLLMLIVQHDPREAVRQAALEEVKDQLFLFKIVMAGRDAKICYQAVRKISDQKLLDRIIIDVRDDVLVSSALRNLTHPGLILDYIEAIEAHGWTEEVLGKLHNTRILFELAKHQNSSIRYAATSQLHRLKRKTS